MSTYFGGLRAILVILEVPWSTRRLQEYIKKKKNFFGGFRGIFVYFSGYLSILIFLKSQEYFGRSKVFEV